jgi:hypothetical protein
MTESSLQHSTVYGYANVYPLREPEWDDMRIAVSDVTIPAVQQPSWVDYKGSKVLAFGDQANDANEERVFFVSQLPHGYKEGTDLEAHVHWVGEDDTAGNVAWEFSYSWADIEGTFPGETISVAVEANEMIADFHQLTDVASMDGTGKKISSMILCSLRRNSSNVADTYTGKDAYLLEFDFHFQLDTPGSATETDKN